MQCTPATGRIGKVFGFYGLAVCRRRRHRCTQVRACVSANHTWRHCFLSPLATSAPVHPSAAAAAAASSWSDVIHCQVAEFTRGKSIIVAVVLYLLRLVGGVLWWPCLSVWLFVCLSLCPLANISHVSELQLIFSPSAYGRDSIIVRRPCNMLMYFRFCGWRHFSSNGPRDGVTLPQLHHCNVVCVLTPLLRGSGCNMP